MRAAAFVAQTKSPAMRLRASKHNTPRAAVASSTAPAYKRDLSDLMKVLETDSPNLFSEQGMDLSIYADDVDFRDPITKYDDIQGFEQNLKFLKNVFDPTYEMLGIRQVSETAVEARWTMGFDVLPVTKSPLGKFWQPKLEFTGTTVYGINEQTGLINLHLDTWDNVAASNQEYFSREAFMSVLAQIFNFQRTPDIPTPQFTLLQKRRTYSIRRYRPFVVAEVNMADAPRGEDRTAAFRSLAAYLFGGNQASTAMQMTTPVISSGDTMQFVLPVESVSDAPQPAPGSDVTLREEQGAVFAVLRFSGQVDEDLRTQKREELSAAMAADGLEPQMKDGSVLTYTAQYNDPRVKPFFRRNEVFMAVSDFDVWQK